MRKKRCRGFALVEFLMIVATVGALVPNISTESAKSTAIISDLRVVQTAGTLWLLENSALPSSLLEKKWNNIEPDNALMQLTNNIKDSARTKNITLALSQGNKGNEYWIGLANQELSALEKIDINEHSYIYFGPNTSMFKKLYKYIQNY